MNARAPRRKLKTVFPSAQNGEHFVRGIQIASRVFSRRRRDGGRVFAQKRIRRFFDSDCRRKRRPAFRARRFAFFCARAQSVVVRLDRAREAQIRQRVFVAAIHANLVGQSREFSQRRAHRRGVAFEKPPATAREQRVAGQQNLLFFAIKRQVIGGVSRRRDGLPNDLPGGMSPPRRLRAAGG